MRILDRERYWAFLKAYVICFTALVGLYIVIDAFSNFDEFSKRADALWDPITQTRWCRWEIWPSQLLIKEIALPKQRNY